MFRRRKQWRPFGDFPTASVQRLPFQREDENKILYTTRYEPHNAEKCGIFEYDLDTKENRAIKLWKDIDYYPRWDVSVYNETQDTIMFVGGANVRNHHHRYDLLVIYDLSDDTVSKYKIPLIVGGNARICLSENDSYLHIIGGTSNDKHIVCDLRSDNNYKLKYMYSFHEDYPQIQSCGLFYSPLLHQLYVFGGRSSSDRVSFDTFWTFDLKNNLSTLSMRDASWLLINGWIVNEVYYKHDNYNIDYPVELNDLVLHFLGISNTIHIWQKVAKWRMPKAIYQFGYVVYKNRVIITFGGRDDTNETIDDIFYLDLMNESDGWKRSKLKCPKRSTYNAVLMEDDTVHIVPFYVHKDHFSIPIKKLLPSKLMEQINFDICTQNCSEVTLEYKEIIKLRYRYFLNKVIISTLIGVIIAAIGLILYFVAHPSYAGICVLMTGGAVILISVLCGKFYEPTQPNEYLLY